MFLLIKKGLSFIPILRVFTVGKSTLSCFVQHNINLFLLQEPVEDSANYRARYALILNNKLLNSGGSLFLQFLGCHAFFVVDRWSEVGFELHRESAEDGSNGDTRPIVPEKGICYAKAFREV